MAPVVRLIGQRVRDLPRVSGLRLPGRSDSYFGDKRGRVQGVEHACMAQVAHLLISGCVKHVQPSTRCSHAQVASLHALEGHCTELLTQ